MPKSPELTRLLGRLKEAQANLILRASETDATPPDSVIAKIADLEVAIGAIEHQISSGAGRDAG